MAAKITRDILESYLHCKSKAHLKTTGQQGIKSDYESLLLEMRADVRLAAMDKILLSHPAQEIPRNIPLTKAAMKQGASFLLDVTLEDDTISLDFDGLKKVDGPSKLGDFHYVPMLFSGRQTVRKEERSFLALYGLLLSRLQGTIPVHGIVWHGNECKATKVRLNADLRSTEKLLRDLKDICNGVSLPKLALNDHCHACEFRQNCHAQALKEDNISLLRSMGTKEITNYARKGILTVTQLAHTFRPRRTPKRAAQSSTKRYHALQALAIRDKRIYVFGTPGLKAIPVAIYLDVESISEQGTVYLIGMIVIEHGSESRYSLWADIHTQERDIFEQFLAIVERYPDAPVFCYGAYERDFLKRMSKGTADKAHVDRVLSRLSNILSLIYSHIYFPTYSNSLKEIGRILNCVWTEPESSGLQSIVWRNRWQSTGTAEWKEKLLNYNLEDCAALKTVTEQIYSIFENTNQENRPLHLGDGTVPVSLVQDLDKLTHKCAWGRVAFFHPEYEYVNNCAYFNYQRDRVYIRSSRTIRKHTATSVTQRNRRLRINKHTQVLASVCPSCNSSKITTVKFGEVLNYRRPRVKRAFDLVFTSGGIQRKVYEFRTAVHRCLECNHEFLPSQYELLDKHFHGLKSWTTYQHVAQRLALGPIQSMVEEFFGIRVSRSEIHVFKALMAKYYEATYQTLLTKILAGPLLHVDETEVKLQVGKGYVWVFTNLEEVFFMYRPTREGDFLKEVLRDFKGVVVSDFYAAYDSLDCPQQKCLIHLIRDMNQELLNNPFDSELQLVTHPFGILLRQIISTVDEHGLKKRHLRRHKRDIARFFQQLSSHLFRSESAESLRARLLKNKDKLFTFIDHDGIPWNNNNAENAIKSFARYRENTVGKLKEAGLTEYLQLLSVCHTCCYKRISFLKFMLSRQTDLDAFCEGKRSKRLIAFIEVFPDGFIPPHTCKRRPKKKSPASDIA